MQKSFSDTVRQAVRNDGRSQRKIAKQTGIAPSQLNRFVRGKRGLTVNALDRLCCAVRVVAIQMEPDDGR